MTSKKLQQHSAALLTVTSVAILVTGIATRGPTSYAEDVVCGDGVVQMTEECDDGNTAAGDGCSELCAYEVCGNGRIDPGEQCDGGMLPAGQGCDTHCFIAFCGDGTVQPELGETCDDTNALPDDGCDATCHLETLETNTPQPTTPAVIPPRPLPVQTTLHRAAPQATTTASVAALATTVTLDPKEKRLIDRVLREQPLSPAEKRQAALVADKLENVLQKRRTTLLDLLQSFIASPISAGVLANRSLDPAHLSQADIEAILAELARVPRMSPTVIAQSADHAIASLRSLGITIDGIPDNFSSLSALERFAIIQKMKEAVETHATLDVSASRAALVEAAHAISRAAAADPTAFPALDRTALFDAVATLDRAAARPLDDKGGNDDVTSAASHVRDLLLSGDVTTPTPDDTQAIDTLHRAAPELASRIGTPESGEGDAFVRTLAAQAPARARSAFARGDTKEQAEALHRLLSEDPAVQRLIAGGDPALRQRLVSLEAAFAVTGTPGAGSVPCSDDIRTLVGCVDTFLAELERTTRDANIVMKTIDRLRAYFSFSDAR